MSLKYSHAKLVKRLNNELTERDISQSDLARLSGIHRSMVSRIFSDERKVNLKNLDKISRALSLSPNYLMYGIKPKHYKF